MKLYQKLMGGLSNLLTEERQESLIYNPIDVKVGGVMSVDDIDYAGLTFVIKKITEINLGSDKFTDYQLLARPISGPDISLKLRISPLEGGGYKILLLKLYHASAFDQGLYDVVRKRIADPEEPAFVIDNEDVHEEFWRVKDVHASFKATTKVLRDLNGDGKVREDEVVRSKLEFWDYSRMTILDGVNVEEFLFVEMDNDGMFEIWRGTEIDAARVDI